MICNHCKARISNEFIYCPVCKFKIKSDNEKASKAGGTVYGNVSNASTAYGESKFHANRGHGFAAERANHLYDKLHGKDAHVLGDDNAKNGADRLVDGVKIQSKYCSTGSKCISECFEKNAAGKTTLRYLNADGSPMQIEVPADKYEDAVRAMQERIKNGQVPGVDNPAKAKDIVRKGNFTYEQAKNIARFGTVESLTYDAVNGIIVGSAVFGVSAVMTFAISIWNGKSVKEALRDAINSGFKVGGVAFLTAVISGQLTKAGIQGVLAGTSKEIVNALGPKASAVLVNSLRNGTNIYGAAAMSSAQKMLSNNLVTGIVSVAVLSAGDFTDVFRGRISRKQLAKNLFNTTGTVASGTGGFMAGAAVGAKAGAAMGTFAIPIPCVGTVGGATIGGAVGGVIGGTLSGSVGNKIVSWISDKVIDDDAVEMINILETEFKEIAVNYVLNENEAKEVVDLLAEEITSSKLKDMYKAKDKNKFAQDLLNQHVEKVVQNRNFVELPTQKQLVQSVRTVLEEIADEEKKVNTNMETYITDWLKEGEKHYNSQRLEVAVECFRKAAKEGVAEAQYKIGWCYHKGRGVRVVKDMAIYWYSKAAEQGHFLAQKRLKELK